MGAYNSSPVTTCESTDSENSRIRYGASSMQGWRMTQEDAMNCCCDFDPETESMLFAVYDGHGGSEVAQYCAKMLPDFLKESKRYKENKTEEALINSFIEFDRMITLDSTVEILKDMAGRAESPVPPDVLRLARRQTDDDEEDEDGLADDELESTANDCDEDETAGLLEDACLPVEQVLQRLTNGQLTRGSTDSKLGAGDEGESSKLVSQSKSSSQNGEALDEAPATESPAGDACRNEAGGSGISIAEPSKSTSKKSAAGEQEMEEEEDSSNDEEDWETADIDSESEEDTEEMRVSQEMALKFTESEDYLKVPGSDSGCTACLALLRGNKLYVANAGDSRCVLSRNGKAVDMSVDHKPEDTVERDRICKAGGFVTPDGRVNGNLNLSRAIGDHNYKRNKKLPLEEQMISALPDIQQETLNPNDEFIIVACDGIWNSLTSQQSVDFVKERIDRGDKISQICEDLFFSVLADDTADGDGTGCDNMTCIIIDLQKSTRPDPKNHRTSSTGFDYTWSEDLPAATTEGEEEPKAKKSKP
ncbi:protein phosphatase 1G-like [Watersipora subatra]|uniref:protein phosphatase 1G-like n=1 Tax=Watersipora subatra TaxID=2589382 RepID=UPI00355AFBFC